MPDPNHLKFILSRLPQELLDRLVLVGGQALIFWAQRYPDALLTPEERVAATSRDIDIIAVIDEVKECTEFWREDLYVKTELSDAEDPSPNTGKSTFPELIDEEGMALEVDFLGSIQGVDTKILKKRSPSVEIEGISIRILHPILLLQSRLANLYELHYPEKKRAREIKRIRITGRVVGSYISEALDAGEIRAARNMIKQLLRGIIPVKYGHRVFAEGVDLLEGLPINDSRFGEAHHNEFIPRELKRINRRRKPYLARR